MKRKRRLPLFPEEVNNLGKGQFLTKRHIRSFILKEYPELTEEYCIFRKFNRATGQVDKKYAWHSIMDVLNKDGRSEIVISKLLE